MKTLSIFLLLTSPLLTVNAQTAVYLGYNHAYGLCYGVRDVKNCAYNSCIQKGGQSPTLLYWTESKGYGALYTAYNYQLKLAVGVAAAFTNLNEAKLKAYNECLNVGGINPQLAETWNDPQEETSNNLTNQHTQGILPYSDCIKTMNVRGFQNVPEALSNKSHRYLFLNAATVRNCGESKLNIYSPTGDIGLRIYGGENYQTILNQVRLYGPYNEGKDDDGSFKFEWMNNCTVYYNYFALIDLYDYNYQNLRIVAEEGDDGFSNLGINVREDDVVFDAIINLDQIAAGNNTITGHCEIPSECATLRFAIDSYESNPNCGIYWHNAIYNVRPLPVTKSFPEPAKALVQSLAFVFWASKEAYNYVKGKAGLGIWPHQWSVIEYADGYCIFNRFQTRRSMDDVINHATGHGDRDWWPWPEGSPHVNLSSYQSALNIAQAHGGIRDIRWIDHPTANCGY